jgi:ClpP class serine protease
MNPILQRILAELPMVEPNTITGWLTPSDTFDRAALAFPQQVLAAESSMMKAMRADFGPKMEFTPDGIAVIPISGVLVSSPSFFEMVFLGASDSGQLTDLVNKATLDRAIKAVVLDINSPGGMVTGGVDIADAVLLATRTKPVVSRTGGMMASLAYMIGSQADELSGSILSVLF